MKPVATIALLLAAASASAADRTITCAEHGHILRIRAVGREHVNHQVTLNGRFRVKELEDGMWFVEKISCSSDGFILEASHVQYGDPDKKSFSLTVNRNGQYELR